LPIPIFEEYQGFRVIFRKPYAKEELRKLGLNERQIKAVEYLLKERKKISRSEYASLFNCSIRTAFNDLQDLVNKKLVKRTGKGRYVYYELL
jgi:ATP-dependent DNA helicase RecG